MEPFYGPEDVPADQLAWLNEQFIVQRLREEDEPFVPYIPTSQSSIPLAALQWPFQWGEGAPSLACLCTAGLGALSQDSASRPFVYENFELGFVLQSPGFSANFVQRFLALAEGLGGLLQGGQTFAVGDWVESAPLVEGFEAAILAPPFPELVATGLRPQESKGGTWEDVDIAPEQWWDPRVLVSEGRRGFLQLCPITSGELAEVHESGEGLRYLLTRLVPQDGQLDPSHWITDPARGAVTQS